MKLLDLWAATESCIGSFLGLPENSVTTEDEHIDAHCAPLLASGQANADEVTFLRETTLGVLRYHAFLDATVDGYCAARKKNKQKAMTMEMIYYLVFYRFEELGPDALRRIIVRTLSHNRIADLLEVLQDDEALEQHLVPRWCTVFDDRYVERVVCGGTLRNNADDLLALSSAFRTMASGVAAAKQKKQQQGTEGDDEDGTIGQGGAPRPAPPPPRFAAVSRLADPKAGRKATEKSTALPPYEVRVLDQVGRREEFAPVADQAGVAEKRALELARKGVRGASMLPPEVRDANRRKERAIPFHEFSSTARPIKLPQLKAEAERRIQELMRPHTTAATSNDPEAVRARLATVADGFEVKPTAAALVREHYVYQQRKRQAEKERLRKEQEMRDDSEFVAWKRQKDEEEEAARVARVEQRKIDLLAGDERARATRVRQAQRNLAQTREDKVVLDAWREEHRREASADAQRRATNAANLRSQLQETAAEVHDKLQTKRRTAVLQTKDESRLREQELAVGLELERQRKQDLIKDIKAAHAAFVARQRQQRETLASRLADASLIGKLEGMSIGQLRIALADTKQQHEAWEEAQRERIRGEKANLAAANAAKAATVEAERARIRAEKEAARAQKRAKEEAKAAQQQKREDQLAVELQARLESQRAGREKEAKDRIRGERNRRLAAQLLSASAGQVQEHRWREMERGSENALLRQQNEALHTQRTATRTATTDASQREANLRRRETEEQSRLDASDRHFREKSTRYRLEAEEDEGVRLAATKRMQQDLQSLRCGAM